MPKLPGVNHLRAVKALEKAGFRVDRQGKHIFMSKGDLKVVVPRNNPVDAYTMSAPTILSHHVTIQLGKPGRC